MKVIEIKVSAKRTTVKITKGAVVTTKTIHNDCFAYCAEQYIEIGALISLEVSKNGNADVYYQGLCLLQRKFNVTESFFGDKLMLFIDKPLLKVA